jgi:ATP-dependent helicase HrpA
VIDLLVRLLPEAHEVLRRLSGRAELSMLPALSDLKGQWERLVHDGFVADAGIDALQHYSRYLAAMGARLDKLANNPRRDAVLMGTVTPLQTAYLDRLAALPDGVPEGEDLRAVRWMVEELRVSLWAQELRTAYPVSVQRVEKALHDL